MFISPFFKQWLLSIDKISVYVLFGITLAILLLGVLGESVNDALRYDRIMISRGEVWRLLTGNIVHLNLNHTLLNLAVWLGLMAAFGSQLKVYQWALLFLILSLGVGSFLYLFNSHILFYVGLSGALYGLLIFSAFTEFKANKITAVILLAFLFGKIVVEQRPDYDVNYLENYIRAPVVVDAHLYGAIWGMFIWFSCTLVGVLRSN